jgi:hypothetical protein
MSQTLHANQAEEYHITVRGIVSADWADYLGGLSLSTNEGHSHPTTILSGCLVDQGALLGVLNNLYSLGFSILSVQYQDSIQSEVTS